MMTESRYDFDLDLTNTNSLSLIIGQIKRGSVVLEFGPANGRMTRYLKEALDCRVYLVEIDEKAGKQAAKYGEDIVIDDAETYSWYEKYEMLRFDYITFADVLEHLRDPEALIAKAKKLLKQDGSILLSVPNLAHNSVAISLLNNEFEYTKTGLLDNTHIHFFTKKSLDHAMERCGLIVAKRFATYAPAGTTEIPVTNTSVAGIDESYWKSRPLGEVYQYVYEAKKGFEFVTETENYLHAGTYPYYFQVFFDYGEGFTEENNKTIQIGVHDEIQRLKLDVPKGVRRIRVDPLNGACMFELKQICQIQEEEKTDKLECAEITEQKIQLEENFSNEAKTLGKKLKRIGTNACYQDEDKFIFTTEDPSIVFVTVDESEFGPIFAEFRFVTIDAIKVKAIYEYFESVQKERLASIRKELADCRKKAEEDCQKLVEDKERFIREVYEPCLKENEQIKRQLYEMKADTNRTRQQLQESNIQIGEYAQTVDILTGSTSWKVTRPIRKLGDLLKRI